MEAISYRTIMIFDENEYPLWNNCMETYLKAVRVDVWLSIVNGYKVPKNPSTDLDEKKFFNCNSKDLHAIIGRFLRTINSKVMSCTKAKEVWDKLTTMYEGDDKVKQVKLKKYRAQFENSKMDEKEDIATYFTRVEEVVNSIRGLGEELKDPLITQKVLRLLPLRYDAKLSAIEETKDLTKMTM